MYIALPHISYAPSTLFFNTPFFLQVNLTGVSRTIGTTTLSAAQLNQLQQATIKGGALHSVLQSALRGSANATGMPRIARPQITGAAAGQTAVLRPQQITTGQQRIALHRPAGGSVIQAGQPARQTIAITPGAVRAQGGQIVVGSPQGAQNLRQPQIVVAGGQQLQAGGQRQIIMTQGGQAVRSGQILQVTGTGGQVQHIVVSQSGQGQVILSSQPQPQNPK